MNRNLAAMVRKNILDLKPYSSARSEFMGDASIYLDANENPFGSPVDDNLNRYPDPLQQKLKEKLATMHGVKPEQIAVGNGSDELIDHIIRIFCRPALDRIMVCPPVFKMYEAAAAINDVAVDQVLLTETFQVDADAVLSKVTGHTRVVFICSPNNPTGGVIPVHDLQKILKGFAGVVVLDEAYIDFSDGGSRISVLHEHPNLIILQTLSKAWGLAGLRVGIAFASEQITEWLLRVKMPYNVNTISQATALKALENECQVQLWKEEVVRERERLRARLGAFDFIEKIFPSQANFLLMRVKNASALYHFLMSKGIVVRNQSTQPLLSDCLRITIGTPAENNQLIDVLNNYTQ